MILVSRSIHEKTTDVVKTMGAEEYLPKPVDLDELCRAIRRVIGISYELEMDIQK